MVTLPVNQIKAQLAGLSEDQRADVAAFLLESLTPPQQRDQASYGETLTRRRQELLSGEVQGIPSKEAFERLKRNKP